MGRVARGDAGAFEEFVGVAGGIVDGYCRRIARDAHEADELRQLTYIRAWSKACGFDGRASLSKWLYRMVVNLAIDEHRRRGRLPVPVERMPEPPQDPGGAMEDEVAGAVDLRAAVVRLAPHYRSVVILHGYWDLSDAEVADRCGIASATVRSRLHRARHTLREALAGS
ncbi:hypothetical protein GCM10022221_55890 [Actinocorallia aurea]